MAPKAKVSFPESLPPEAVTQTFAILGIRGSGKTNTAVVMTENMLRAKHQVVVIDPVDVWWGLKSSKDGKHPGFAIPVLGGDHADVPLDGLAGPAIADFVTETRASVVLSVRHLSMNDQRRFAGEFAKRLYERKGQQRSPLMLMVDEADEFVPQHIVPGHQATFGAFDRLVRRGRSSGIGVTLISQRAQVVNKDVLSQMETLVAMRVLHKLDRKALEAWIEAHDTEGRKEAFLSSLASLNRGDAWIWSPSWLGMFERVHIRERSTFDSSATPDTGGDRAAPQELAPVDLAKLRESLAGQIEKAKLDDPKELRRRITELERELKKPAPAATMTSEREQEIRKEAARSAHQQYLEPLQDITLALEAIRKESDRLYAALEQAHHVARFIDVITEPKRPAQLALPPRPNRDAVRRDGPRSQPKPNPQGNLTGPEQRILDAIAWMESITIDVPEQTAVAFLAGYTVGGGAFNNPRGSLRVKGLVEYEGGDRIRLTAGGRDLANVPDAPLNVGELQRRVTERLPGPEAKILNVLLEAYPRGLTNEECARLAGYSPGGGAYNNPRGRLRTLGLIEYVGGLVRARDLLFLRDR